MELINKYFPDLTDQQMEQFTQLEALFLEWNAQINVISRKDTEHFYERHVLHSLAIAKVCEFFPTAEILDIGTGGGFPGIPLAILFPQSSFTLVDSIGKKIKVVNEISEAIGLKNIRAEHIRAEQLNESFDFIVSRAVTQMPRLMAWTRGKIRKGTRAGSKANGVLYLKGGDLKEELADYQRAKIYDIPRFFSEDFFETKKVVYLKA